MHVCTRAICSPVATSQTGTDGADPTRPAARCLPSLEKATQATDSPSGDCRKARWWSARQSYRTTTVPAVKARRLRCGTSVFKTYAEAERRGMGS